MWWEDSEGEGPAEDVQKLFGLARLSGPRFTLKTHRCTHAQATTELAISCAILTVMKI